MSWAVLVFVACFAAFLELAERAPEIPPGEDL